MMREGGGAALYLLAVPSIRRKRYVINPNSDGKDDLTPPYFSQPPFLFHMPVTEGYQGGELLPHFCCPSKTPEIQSSLASSGLTAQGDDNDTTGIIIPDS